MKFFIIAMLIAIVASLGSGLFYLSKDGQGSSRVLKSLQIRVALSVVLLLALLASYFLGWLGPMPGS